MEMETRAGEAESNSTLNTEPSFTSISNQSFASRENGDSALSKSYSTGDIPLMLLEENKDMHDAQLSSLEAADKLQISSSTQSLSDILGEDITDDSFQREVAKKTQTFMVGRREAETEVVIDRLIVKEGSKDKALLHVVSQMVTEVKVQIFVTTLLHRGANPSFADSNWQTPLHHAVKRGFKSVVNELLEHDALPHVRDKEKKFPLHMAIEGCHDEIGSLLLKYMPHHVVRELFITYDKDSAECSLHELIEKDMQQTSLAVLDCMVDVTAQTSHMKIFYHVLEADMNGRPPPHPKFEPNAKSCLHLISKRGYKNIISHLVVRLLIRRKWKEFARLRFQLNSFLYLITLAFLTFSAVVAVDTPDPTSYAAPIHYARAVSEMWSLLAVAGTLVVEINQFRKHKLDYWRDQFNWIDLISSILLLTVVPLRFTHHQEQWHVYGVGYLFWTLRIFKYAPVFRQTGAYAQILWRIVSHDFLQFTVLFLVILLSFSGSFVLALRGDDSLGLHNETNSFWNVLFTGVRILIEGQPVVEYAGADGYKYVVLLVNFFILLQLWRGITQNYLISPIYLH